MEAFQLERVWDLASGIAGPLLAAICLGALIGWNREGGDKPAGLRTHMMVALGAAAFTMTALGVYSDIGGKWVQGPDPIRIIEGIATGIGFLGAGCIIRTRGDVRGITTAAGIWVVGGVGAACGAGLYGVGIAVTLLALMILTLAKRLERRFLRH